MDASALAGLHTQVLLGALGLALLLGAALQRSHFCIMGAVSDAALIGDWTRGRMWAVAGGVAVLGFGLLAHGGWVTAAQTLYGGARLLWASALGGGLLFGIGMVLASGCGAKTLVRLGSGNLKALVVLLVMGLSAFMTMRGLTAVWRDRTLDRLVLNLPGGQDLPSLLGLPPLLAAGLVALPLLGFGLWRARSEALWGVLIGLLVTATWMLTAGWAYGAEHPETLEAFYAATTHNRPESFSFVGPSAGLLDWLIHYSDLSKRLNVGVVGLLGVVAGSAAAALWHGEFRWEGFRQTEDLVAHLAGALLMGVGGVTALGCTFGQGLSGLSTLSLGSLLAVTGIVAGGLLGVRLQLWRAGRD
jgi:uncharacterized membrane protein YedE/YeeE